MKRWFSEFSFYAKKPEMRIFWLFLIFAVVIMGIQTFWLPWKLSLLVSLVFLMIAGVFFNSTYKLAKTNFAVRLEHEQLMGMFISLQDGVIAYDSNFKIQVFNGAAERLFGIKQKEVVDKEFSPNMAQNEKFKLLSQAMFPSLAPVVVPRTPAGEWPQVVDVSFTDPVLELRITTAKILNPKGGLLGFMKIIQNRTREVEIARSKSEFVTVAAHQLRTPLSAVAWTFETLAEEAGIPKEFKELIGNGRIATAKLLKTVNDLLDVSKIEEGRFGYQMEELDIIGFVNNVLSQKMAVAKPFGIKMYFDPPQGEKEIKVKIDPKKLTIVLDNFLDNAIKYNVKNGEITVKIKRMEGKPYVQVDVTDTGVGVPPEQIKKLFTKFFRAENVVKFKTEGTGLGLYIVKNIMRQHGGQVWAESTINRGSTFSFSLPTDTNLVPQKEVFTE